jgi:deazaflavin-dependent oxidoreductase (nitroreductase family)
MTSGSAYTPERHVRPDGRLQVHMHRFVGFLATWGIALLGTRLLSVRGRTSGQWRSNPVNLLTVGGERYLVSPRGRTQWVRNIRVAGGGELRLGRSIEAFTVTELADEDKLPVLREYFRKWGWEISAFFDGLTSDATDEQLAAVAPGVPAFRID